MQFSVFNYIFNDTLLSTGEASFQHPAWTQNSGLGAAYGQLFQTLSPGSVFQCLAACGRLVSVSGAKQPMCLNASISSPPCSKDAYFQDPYQHTAFRWLEFTSSMTCSEEVTHCGWGLVRYLLLVYFQGYPTRWQTEHKQTELLQNCCAK